MTYQAGIKGKELITAYFLEKDGLLDIDKSSEIIKKMKTLKDPYISDMGTAIQEALGGIYWKKILFEGLESINYENDNKNGIVFKFSLDSDSIYIIFHNFEMNIIDKHVIRDF